MKLAIMQPYFFPYVGYFQLMAVVDKFVFLSDVQYIRRGWVNRNRIPSRDKDFQYLTVPVAKHARESTIEQMQIAPGWIDEHLSLLRHAYGKKIESHPLIRHYSGLGRHISLNEMLCESLMWTARYLGLNCDFAYSSGISHQSGQRRILDICRHYGATSYLNLSGGKDLYDAADFGSIKLQFMPPTQYTNCFSIIDPILTEEDAIKSWLARLTPQN